MTYKKLIWIPIIVGGIIVGFYLSRKKEFIKNPSFEEADPVSPEEPRYWYRNFEDATHVLTWDDTVSHSGNKSLRMDVLNSTKEWFAWDYYLDEISDLNPIEQGDYILEFWVKGESIASGSAVPYVHFHEYDANGNESIIKDVEFNMEGTFDWTKLTYLWTPESNTAYLRIGLDFYGTNGIVWYDDVSLNKIDI